MTASPTCGVELFDPGLLTVTFAQTGPTTGVFVGVNVGPPGVTVGGTLVGGTFVGGTFVGGTLVGGTLVGGTGVLVAPEPPPCGQHHLDSPKTLLTQTGLERLPQTASHPDRSPSRNDRPACESHGQ